LKQKLDGEVAKDAIICLQEVSVTCAGSLHSYFASKDYHFVTGLYGNKFNGYMGVGVAVPLTKYVIEGVDITRVADTKKMVRKPQEHSIIKLARRLLLNPLMDLLRALGLFRPAFKPFDDALKRMNQMVTLKVRPKNSPSSSPFVVGTYHMPCMFQYPAVMMIHCALSAQHIQRYAGDLPFVFTGDFNIKPKDPMYRLLTSGTIDAQEPARPVNEPGDVWSPLVQPMRSAYVEKNGSEPPFTNWAKVKDDPPFIDTLDYLFLSPHWKVAAVEPLPEVQGPLPVEEEPSDHLLISATLDLS
jgi:mRNA deadenylase 3'-5' endonuclease subunit Ccr4